MSSEQPKEFGKKYTPKAGGGVTPSSPSSGIFSKTTPIFAKRNLLSSIQQSATPTPPPSSSEETQPPAEPSATPPSEESSSLLAQKPLDQKLPPLSSEQPIKPLAPILPGGIRDPLAAPLPNRELLTPIQPITPQPIASATPPHLSEPTSSPQLSMLTPTPLPSLASAAPKSNAPPSVSFAPDERSLLATQRDIENQVLVPAGTEVEGIIKTDRAIIIHGRVGGVGKNLGNLFTNSLIYISKTAKVEANIQCSRLEIYGNVDGEIIAREEVLLHKGGKLQGKVQTPHFKTEPGSFFKGTMEMTGSDVSVATAPSSSNPPLSTTPTATSSTSLFSTRKPAA